MIRNMNELRLYILNTLERLEDGSINVSHASAVARLSDQVINASRLQIEYSLANGLAPSLDFMGDCVGISAPYVTIFNNEMIGLTKE